MRRRPAPCAPTTKPELALVSSIKQHPPSLNASKCTREELQENLKDQGKNKWEEQQCKHD